jgi:hypothetical protein
MPFNFSGLNFFGDVSAQAVFAPPAQPYLLAWGRNQYGQLGLGNTSDRSSPVQVGTLTNANIGIDTSSSHNLIIKTDGTLWSWGTGTLGRLGLGDTNDRSSPVQIGALTTWSRIVAGGDHSLAISTNGTMWSWGYNGFGQLGLGNLTGISSPVQIGAGTTWSRIGGGFNHSVAIKTDGTL